ncbi:bifunctional diguanylate cyclase/phosphodiesterase [Vibrio sp. ZSDE26]|uniref:Bifunctional diguanylate cyclase/phosphodiesterase n=1 Tax=Vibrio amylolyticus TaxID=2847292 RepID=A0A9X2BHI8_9VIBR|nr:bifunctional diguanylate cyclase/phosphodiesterase [Vibrio amylolyticus]MCK6264021.1 bifunctional diguanylate cyclase/phosphodiesterase [Vibrio amylolyticus]
MAMRLENTGAIGLDDVNDTLLMEGSALLDHVALKLHKQFQSFSTCIIELDKLHYNAKTLSYAQDKFIQPSFNYALTNTPCELVGQSDTAYCVFTENLREQFPLDSYIQENQLRGYIGVALKNHTGETLGVLLSTFDTEIEDPGELLFYHCLFANIIVHSLRAKWLAQRSDSLVSQLSYEVSHDSLTGLCNRSCLSDRLEILSQSSSKPFTLIYLDVDNFKSINDLHGNYTGDQILRFVATVISDAISEHNLGFRIAGDEFAFITYATDPIRVCHDIIHTLKQGYKDPSHDVSISVSIGMTRTQDQVLTAEQMMLNASLALKDCKKATGTKIRCYDTQLSAIYHRKTQVINALRTELSKPKDKPSEIFVAAQPIVHKHSTHWRYFEILARWNSEHLGTISPVEFIEAAEQSGLIIELGERIVQLACEAKMELEKGFGHKVKLGINCSAHELNGAERYIEHLTSTISSYGFDAHDFVIELTETVLITRGDDVQLILDKLRDFGFTIALDDFGTGYSSLNYLHTYPIDCIKIDATFIRNMLDNKKSERVVRLIIQLAEQLNVALVAEGVETIEALEKLYSMGCVQIQGYYFSRPEVPIAIVNNYYDAVNHKGAIKSA